MKGYPFLLLPFTAGAAFFAAGALAAGTTFFAAGALAAGALFSFRAHIFSM